MMTGMLRAEMIGKKGTFYSAEKGTKRADVDNAVSNVFDTLKESTFLLAQSMTATR